jgi:predicted DNA-binding protein (MmcQ/YjbR family)
VTLHTVAAFRRYVGMLPAVTVAEQWDGHVAKVGGKVFSLIGGAGTPIVFKVSELSFDGLTTLEGIGQAAYFAKRAWASTTARHSPIPSSRLTSRRRMAWSSPGSRRSCAPN